jgi:hypothetical protein
MMDAILGKSWIPSVLGYLMAALTFIQSYLQSGTPFPQDGQGWTQFLFGIGLAVFGRTTKQFNVSNAATPVAGRPVDETTGQPKTP